MRRAAVLLFLLAWLPAAARAHKPSDSYLALRVEGERVAGQWDVALRDLEFALGLDGDGDGRITWGELRKRKAAIEAYALPALALAAGGAPCAARPLELLVDRHTDGAYAVLRFEAACTREIDELSLRYTLFAALDPQHRGLVRIERGDSVETAVLGGPEPERRFALAGRTTPLDTFFSYAGEGVRHIAVGADHLLFLLSLLLPAVLRREAGRWAPAASLREVALEVARVVTAFTAAHATTLSLAALDLVVLPSRLVESGIALSVALAALNNLWPVVDARRWAAAFGFGLLHGFGFASTLAGLGLPSGALATALFGFNAGVELGQLAAAAVVLPVAFAARGSWAYQRLAFGAGSLAIAGVALVWLVQRSFGLAL
jgi:hypothetical protein